MPKIQVNIKRAGSQEELDLEYVKEGKTAEWDGYLERQDLRKEEGGSFCLWQ